MSPLLPLLLLAAAPPADLEAAGVVLSGPAGTPVAILRSAGRSRAVAVGEKAFDVTLVAVSPQVVTVEADGKRTDIRLSSVSAAPAPLTPPLAEATAATSQAQAPNAEAAQPSIRTIDRREVERRLALEVPRILAETVAVPVTEDGRIVGLALTRLADGTVLGETGLRAGDVLTKLNDTPVDGLPALLGLWPRFQSESQIRAEVLRNGQPVTLTLNIR